MPSSKTIEWAFKLISLAIGVAIIPLFTWVWTADRFMHEEVTRINGEDAAHHERLDKVESMLDIHHEQEARLARIETDLGWVKLTLHRIEQKVQ